MCSSSHRQGGQREGAGAEGGIGDVQYTGVVFAVIAPETKGMRWRTKGVDGVLDVCL